MGRIERSNKDRLKNGIVPKDLPEPNFSPSGFLELERGAHLEDAEVQELLRKLVENS